MSIDRSAPIIIETLTSSSFTEDWNACKSVDEQLALLSSLAESLSPSVVLEIFVSCLLHNRRREYVQTINGLIQAQPGLIADIVSIVESHAATSSITPWLRRLTACVEGPTNSAVVTGYRSHLASSADGNTGVLSELMRMLGSTDSGEVKLLICRLILNISQLGFDPKALSSSTLDAYRGGLVAILNTTDDTVSRDLLTQSGYLLCLHFGHLATTLKFHLDESKSPIARMSVMRATVSLQNDMNGVSGDVSEVIAFYSQFDRTAMDIHYSVQSIQLLLLKRFRKRPGKSTLHAPTVDTATHPTLTRDDGMRVVETCLLRWDHPWQMVSSTCRSLYGLVCQLAEDVSLVSAIRARVSSLETGSRRRFNCLFSLIEHHGWVECEAHTVELMKELLTATRSCSPSVASACQLVQVLLVDPGLTGVLVRELVQTTSEGIEIDLNQLVGAISKAKRENALGSLVDTLMEPGVLDACTEERKTLLLLRLVLHSFGPAVALGEHGVSLQGRCVFSGSEFDRFLISNDSTIACVAAVILVRYFGSSPVVCGRWRASLSTFFTNGGIASVSTCNDDRSVLSHELTKFLEKRLASPTAVEVQREVFTLLWRSALTEDATEEEAQLPAELLCSLSPAKLHELIGEAERFEFFSSLVLVGLESPWRKIRAACRSLFPWTSVGDAVKSSFVREQVERGFTNNGETNEELAGALFDLAFGSQERDGATLRTSVKKMLLNSPLLELNEDVLTGIAQGSKGSVVSFATEVCGDMGVLVSRLIGAMIHSSQYIGEDCVESALLAAATFLTDNKLRSEILTLNRFMGTVDCRGHPILGNDVESTSLSLQGWTRVKVSALALKALLSHASVSLSDAELISLAETVTILLLSIKHPAAIAPLESLFSATLARLPTGVVTDQLLAPLMAGLTDSPQLLGTGKDTTTGRKTFTLPAALRRSQGLGPLIGSIVRTVGSVSCLASVVSPLLSVINLAVDDSELLLHALNVLRSIVRNSTISNQILDPFLGDILLASLRILHRLGKDWWRVRSNATQLFVQTARRVIGSDNEDTAASDLTKRSRKEVSAAEFFFNRPSGSAILSEMVQVLGSGQEDVIVSILAVIQPLSRFDEIASPGNPDGALLLQEIEKGIESNSVHVRRLCAKMQAKRGHRLPSPLLKGDCVGWNAIHGHLLVDQYMLQFGLLTGDHAELGAFVTSLLSRKDTVPSLVMNAALHIATFILPTPAIVTAVRGEELFQFLQTVDESQVRSSVGLASLVRACCGEFLSDPIMRRLAVVAVKAATSDWVKVWLKDQYLLGVVAMGDLLLSAEPRLVEEVMAYLSERASDMESIDDEIKIAMAKSVLVRDRCPEITLKLLFDESPVVKSTACIDGLNVVMSRRALEQRLV